MRLRFFVWVGLLIVTPFVYADAQLVQRPEVRAFIDSMVKQHGVDKTQLTASLMEAKYQPQIIESMEKPYEKKPWDVYKKLFLTPERLQAGLLFWQQNKDTLDRAEKQFGVPAHVIVAILGVETLYGKHQGTYRVLDALTTLAFYYPPRHEYFTKELREFFLLCQEQGVSPTTYLGSYAGAMGKPQFMPSSYRFYAIDFTGNGKRDLMNEDRDVIASVANYFHQHGWNDHVRIASPAQITGSKFKSLTMNTKQVGYTLTALKNAGIKPLDFARSPGTKAGLIELMRQDAPEYWVTYPNFYVITRYNSSPQYALVVYLFSQQLLTHWALSNGAHVTNQSTISAG